MAFLRSRFSPEPHPVLKNSRVLLRVPDMADYAAWLDLRLASRDFLTPWEPQWPANDLDRSAFRLRLKRYWRDIDEDQAFPFFIFSADGKTLLGAVTLSNVRRGVAQMASLGYWIGQPYAKRGYMTAAVRLVQEFGLGHMQLHRIEAACLPHNAASIALLLRCGFMQEGVARGYLKINGAWQDHALFACATEQS